MPVRLSVRREQLGSHWTHFHESWYLRIFRKPVENIQVSLKSDKNKGYFTWRTTHIFVITSRSFLLRMRNVPDKSCRENQNTHFVYSNIFFEKCAVYEIMWENVQRGTPQMTIWRMCIAFWIPKAINPDTGCVILIAFPRQQWLHERASMLRYTHIACLSLRWYIPASVHASQVYVSNQSNTVHYKRF
jgi:hypothetical protein